MSKLGNRYKKCSNCFQHKTKSESTVDKKMDDWKCYKCEKTFTLSGTARSIRITPVRQGQRRWDKTVIGAGASGDVLNNVRNRQNSDNVLKNVQNKQNSGDVLNNVQNKQNNGNVLNNVQNK